MSADVVLADDPEPVLGSFTVDGLTYAVRGEGEVCLVAVAPATLAGGLAGGSAGAEGVGRGVGRGVGSGWATSPQPLPAPSAEASGLDGGEAAADGQSGADGSDEREAAAVGQPSSDGSSGPVALSLPDTIAFDGIDYSLTAIGPRALAGCSADSVALPASVASVDPTALQGCPASSIEVAADSPYLSSYDGMLFDADRSSLLLIPEGKQGVARIPETTEEVDPALFSHSEGVSSISVDAGNAAFSSRNGCLYDASGETLLRIAVGTTDASIPDGCASLAPRALEGCSQLKSLAAPPSVVDVSPDSGAPDPLAIMVSIPKVVPREIWESRGFSVEGGFSTKKQKAASEGSTGAPAVEEAADLPLAALEVAQVSDSGPSAVTLQTGLAKTDVNESMCYFEHTKNLDNGTVEYSTFSDGSLSTAAGYYYISPENRRFNYYRTSAAASAKRVSYAVPYRYGAYCGAYDMFVGTNSSTDSGFDIDAGVSNEWANSKYKDSNMTLKAKWVNQPKFTVTLDDQGGTGGSGNFKNWHGWEFSFETPSFTSQPISKVAVPTKTGYVFAGYWTKKGGEGDQYVDRTGKIIVADNMVKSSKTVYAHWVEADVVSFNANGGSGGQSAAVTATRGAPMPAIDATKPTRTGYAFGGWYDTPASTGGTQYYTAEGASARNWDKTSDTTLYARWTASTYTVSFNANGGTGGQSANVTATYDAAMPAISTAKPTRTGYTFGGWYDASAASGGTQYYTAAGASARSWNKTSNATLYARWTAVTSKVSFDANGGSGGQSAQVTATYDSAMPAISTTKPTRTGYTFGGWYDASAATGGTQYYTAACASARNWNRTSDTTLYARWTANKYKVTFDRQGGTGGTADATATFGEKMPAIEAPTRAGYAFRGYFDQREGKGSRYYSWDCWTNSKWDKGSAATLYAKWDPIGATVTHLGPSALHYKYELSDGTGSSGTASSWGLNDLMLRIRLADGQVVAEGPSYNSDRDIVTRCGLNASFKGVESAWLVTEAQDGKRVGSALESSWASLVGPKSATVYLNGHGASTVTWDGNGGTPSRASDRNVMPYATVASAPTATRTGYSFKGWYTARTGGSKACDAGKATPQIAKATTYYARWEASTATVFFNVNGGGGSGYQTVAKTATFDADMPAISTTKPTRTGYTFKGWYDNADWSKGTQYYTAEGKSARTWNKTSNATLYAGWEPIMYNVRFHTKDGTVIGWSGHAYDTTFDLDADPKLTHAAYTAKGWAKGSGQSKADYAFSQSVTNLSSTFGAYVDLYLAEEANEYSISYDAKGGTLSGQRTKYTFETADFQLIEPTRTGYTFMGWTVTGAAEGSAGVVASGASSTVRQGTWGNLSCVANWRANECRVALGAGFPEFANGSTYAGYASHGVAKDAGTGSVTATYDSPMPAATMPRAIGYAFQGYFDQPGGAGAKYYDADGSSVRAWDKPNAATLYGHWVLERHELTLDVGDGEVPSAADRGWSRDAGGTGLYRLTYSIEWVEESGGSPRIQLPVPATKPGYSAFDGWVGGGISKPSRSVIVQPWELADRAYSGAFSGLVGYTASLDLDGGRFEEVSDGWTGSGGAWERPFTIESAGFALPTPTRAGHDFLGWALVGAGGSLGSPDPSASVPKGTVGDRAWRAAWQARTYGITWHYAGQVIDGGESAASTQAYGDPIAFPARPSVADPAREHYSFEGWFTEREGGDKVQPGSYLLEHDATFYARWAPVEYVVHLHLGDDDAYAEHKAHIEQDGAALPMAPDGHFDMGYTVEDEVSLPRVTDDPSMPKPVREGMEFKGWVECAADGTFDEGLAPSLEVVLPVGSSGERHYRAIWAFALRFEVPSAVGFRFDLADDPAFADEPYGPVQAVSGDGVELRSLSLGQLAVADVAVDVSGAQPDAIVADRSKVQLRVRDASLPDPGYGWVPLPMTSAPEGVDRFDLEDLGFGMANALAPLAAKPLCYELEVQDPATTLVGEVANLPLARVVFTVQGLW